MWQDLREGSGESPKEGDLVVVREGGGGEGGPRDRMGGGRMGGWFMMRSGSYGVSHFVSRRVRKGVHG